MPRNVLFSLVVLAVFVQAGPGRAQGDSTEVTGTIVVPAEVPSVAGATVEIRLYECHPMIADKAATLIDKVRIKNFAHTQGKETRAAFSVGKKPGSKVNPQMRYYVTLFFHSGDPAKTPRTHIGEATHRKGLCRVLTGQAPGRSR